MGWEMCANLNVCGEHWGEGAKGTQIGVLNGHCVALESAVIKCSMGTRKCGVSASFCSLR